MAVGLLTSHPKWTALLMMKMALGPISVMAQWYVVGYVSFLSSIIVTTGLSHCSGVCRVGLAIEPR